MNTGTHSSRMAVRMLRFILIFSQLTATRQSHGNRAIHAARSTDPTHFNGVTNWWAKLPVSRASVSSTSKSVVGENAWLAKIIG